MKLLGLAGFGGTVGCINIGSVFSDTIDTYEAGFQTYSTRVRIPSAQISAGGSKAKITLTSVSGVFGCVVDDVYCGHFAGSGDAWDFDGNQVQVYFGDGDTGVTLSNSGESTQSDEFDLNIDGGTDLIIAIGINNTASQQKAYGSTSGIVSYRKSGGNGEEGDTAPAGYTGDTDTNDLVSDIEITCG